MSSRVLGSLVALVALVSACTPPPVVVARPAPRPPPPPVVAAPVKVAAVEIPKCLEPAAGGPAAKAGTPRQVVEGRAAGAIVGLALSPSGALVAAGAADGSVRVWDARSRHLLRTIRRPGLASPTMLEWLDEARLLVGNGERRSGATKGEDLARGAFHPEIVDVRTGVTQFDLSATGAPVHTLQRVEGHPTVGFAAKDDTGRYHLFDRGLRHLRRLETSIPKPTAKAPPRPAGTARPPRTASEEREDAERAHYRTPPILTPDGRFAILERDADDTMRSGDMITFTSFRSHGAVLHELAPNAAPAPRFVAFPKQYASTYGRTLAAFAPVGRPELEIWSLGPKTTRTSTIRLPPDAAEKITSLTLSRDEAELVATFGPHDTSESLVFRVRDGKLAARTKTPKSQAPAPWNPWTVLPRDVKRTANAHRGVLHVAGASDGRVWLLDERTKRPTGQLGAAAVERPLRLAFLDDGHVLSVSERGRVTSWSTGDASRSRLGTVPGVAHIAGADVYSVELPRSTDDSPSVRASGTCGSGPAAARAVRAVGGDRAICIAVGTPATRETVDVHPASGRFLAVVERDDIPPPTALVSRVVKERGRKVWVLSDIDITNRTRFVVVDAATGARVPLERSTPTWSAWFSPDGAWVLAPETITSDTTFRASTVLFDARTGRIAARYPESRPELFAFRADGRRVALAAGDTVRVYEVPDPSRPPSFTLKEGVDVDAVVPEARPVEEIRGTRAVSLTFAGESLVGTTRDGSIVRLAGGAASPLFKGDGTLAYAVAGSPSGELVAAATADGSIRLIDAKRGGLRASLAEFDDDEWIVAAPDGSYVGTTEVGDRVGWVFDAPLEHFPFEQFASTYRSRDAVLARLTGSSDAAPATPPGRPPRLELVGAPEVTDGGARARLTVRASGADRVESVRLFVEGRLVDAKLVCQREGEATLEAALLPGTNRLTAVAFDARGLSSNPTVSDVLGPPHAKKPEVWVLGVGVSAYPSLLKNGTLAPAARAAAQEKLDLPAAREDARGIAEAFTRLSGEDGFYSAVHATTLLDGDATPDRIRGALADLARMRPEDLAVILLAGHGFKPDAGSDMVFATGATELDRTMKSVTPESLARHTVGWREISEALRGAKGRVLLLLDACHSGHVSQEIVAPNEGLATSLVRDGRAGVIVLAAAKGRQVSLEPRAARSLALDVSPSATRAVRGERHGYFTGAFLQSLEDRSTDGDGDGMLQLSEVIDDVARRVREASRGAQTPWLVRRDQFGDFALARSPKKP